MKILKWIGLLFVLLVVAVAGATIQFKVSEVSQNARTGADAADANGITKMLEPVTVLDEQLALTSHLHPGSVFYVHRHFNKSLACSVAATRYLVNETSLPNIYISFNTTTTTWMRAGDYDLYEQYMVPSSVPSGEYHFRLKNTQTCAGVTYYTLGFDVVVTIN